MPTPLQRIRVPAVAGAFYPLDPTSLNLAVRELLAAAPTTAGWVPKALIVPHAGYVYSGPVAAAAFSLLRHARTKPSTVVLLGPSHHVAFRGMRLPAVDALRTPLGEVPVDTTLAEKARAFPLVSDDARAHAREHSLEVQLPFLQVVLDAFTVLPLVVGDATPGEVAEVLGAVWGGPETLIVVSSDLSHDHPAAQARSLDAATAERILRCDPRLAPDEACGAAPVNGLLQAAREHLLGVRLLDLRNSGDTAGGHSRVVGYGAFVLAGGRS